jgi:hypothetical protein
MNTVVMLRYCLVSAEPRRDENGVVFWLLNDFLATFRSSNCCKIIQLKIGKKNENENVKENEYDGDASLVGPLRGRRGKSQTSPTTPLAFKCPR